MYIIRVIKEYGKKMYYCAHDKTQIYYLSQKEYNKGKMPREFARRDKAEDIIRKIQELDTYKAMELVKIE